MSHMKEISIRELHRNTGAWVRNARKYGSILVRDRNTPVATLTPTSEEPTVNVFERWTPLKRFAAALDRPVGGTPVEDIISDDRNR
jgi:antitoxin (DNA-binding transcriptional repressor) of toxin-antitoxin stability system